MLSLTLKYPILLSFYSDLNKFKNPNPQKESTNEKKKTTVYYDNASELYNEYLEIYLDEYKALSDVQKRNLGNKYDPINLFIEKYNHYVCFENKQSADTTRKSDKKFCRFI